MDVEVELSRIIINETSDQQVIVLKERNGERGFSIIIGIVEIFAIDRRIKGLKPPRPMTHDLLEQVIKGLDAKIEKIVINDLRNHTFYAKIHLNSNGKVAEIDVFQGSLKGLIVVDFEFDSMEEKESFEMPDFCLADVTNEVFIAGGMVCGKSYEDIENNLKKSNYVKLFLD